MLFWELVWHPLKRESSSSHLSDQVRVADDGPHKEAVVGDLGAHLHPGGAQVQVHLVVGARDGRQGEVAHAIELQLESQRWLQVAVDPVLLELFFQSKEDGVTQRCPSSR